MSSNKYSLVGVDGNAFSIIGYTAKVLKEVGRGDLVDKMREEAMSRDYYHLIYVCDKYVSIANKQAEARNEY